MRRRLVIRADADSRAGIGHVMRMMALAQAWKSVGGEVEFVAKVDAEPLRARLRGEGLSLIDPAKVHPSPDDVEGLLARTDSAEWIALDGYHLDTMYQSTLHEAGRRTLVMDDVNDRGEYVASILVNQNVDATEYEYATNLDALRLMGTRYAMLRQKFLERAKSLYPVPEQARNVLVSFGGGDPLGLTEQTLGALKMLDVDSLHVKAVLGPMSSSLEKCRSLVAELSFQCELLYSVNDMPRLMEWADLAVGAAGSTCWELCLMGVPMAVVVVADNQRGVGRSLEAAGAALCFGSTLPSDFYAQLSKLMSDPSKREAMRRAAMGLVDGRGARRVAGEILMHNMALRDVVASDWETLLSWRNAPSVREKSFNAQPVSIEEHQRWLAAFLENEQNVFFMAEDEAGIPLGQIRFDLHGESAVISLSVDPNLAGCGIGTRMTRLACGKFVERHPGVEILAHVKPDNKPSLAMFRSAGFRLADGVESGAAKSVSFRWSE